MVEILRPVEAPRENLQPPLLEIKDLTFGYTGQILLYAVQTRVSSGEMVGLLGPNGSGKTTLLRLISGVLRAGQGQILLDGRELANWGRRGIAQRIAVVPQELQVPFAFTVEQMVALGRTPFIHPFGSRTKRDQEIVREAMRLAEVEILAERIFNELSGGERQRVMVAMALAQQPRLLLLDEPTSHLDIKYQFEMLELVQHLNSETGVTVIAAMHDLNLAARYFPRLLLFQRGIVADGGPAEVLEPHLLQRVYGVHVQVGVMRGSEYLSVFPPGVSMFGEDEALEQPGVHVMAGGGSGALMMRALADAHVAFSAGVLNIGDSDHTLALRLASEVITEQPFAAISDATRLLLQARLQQTSFLLFCALPIGPGNLALLQDALAVCRRGVPVCLLLPATRIDQEISDELLPADALQLFNIQERDYTHGEATQLVLQLLETGARVIAHVSQAVTLARQLLLPSG
jgi:iron complex transport system ATP-binding protein